MARASRLFLTRAAGFGEALAAGGAAGVDRHRVDGERLVVDDVGVQAGVGGNDHDGGAGGEGGGPFAHRRGRENQVSQDGFGGRQCGSDQCHVAGQRFGGRRQGQGEKRQGKYSTHGIRVADQDAAVHRLLRRHAGSTVPDEWSRMSRALGPPDPIFY